MIDQQLEMFMAQPRKKKSESPQFQAAVLFLRKHGIKVRRVSNYQSMLNDSLIENRRLVRLAAKMGWERNGR